MVPKQNGRNYEGKKKVNIYREGYASFRVGNLSNPYPENTNNYRSWQFGFNTAYFENLKKVKLDEQIRGRSKEIHEQEK